MRRNEIKIWDHSDIVSFHANSAAIQMSCTNKRRNIMNNARANTKRRNKSKRMNYGRMWAVMCDEWRVSQRAGCCATNWYLIKLMKTDSLVNSVQQYMNFVCSEIHKIYWFVCNGHRLHCHESAVHFRRRLIKRIVSFHFNPNAADRWSRAHVLGAIMKQTSNFSKRKRWISNSISKLTVVVARLS